MQCESADKDQQPCRRHQRKGLRKLGPAEPKVDAVREQVYQAQRTIFPQALQQKPGLLQQEATHDTAAGCNRVHPQGSKEGAAFTQYQLARCLTLTSVPQYRRTPRQTVTAPQR